MKLVQKIQQLLKMDWEVWICHIYCELNTRANALAMECDISPNFMFYEWVSPTQISLILLADGIGVSIFKLIGVSTKKIKNKQWKGHFS